MEQHFHAMPTETALNIAGSPRGSLTTGNPFGESLKTVTKQLLQAPTATDMVITDIRTPPKIKTQHKTNDEFVPLGKGEAIPISMDDHDAYELIHSTSQEQTATKDLTMTPASTGNGISTWILLSNSDSTTPTASATQLKSQKPTNPTMFQSTYQNNNDKKKGTKPEHSTTTETLKTSFDIIAKPERKQPTNKPNTNTTKKNPSQNNNKDDDVRTPITINLQDTKFKNRQPVIMGRVPTTSTTITKNKTDNVDSNSNYKKKVTSPPPQPTSEIKIETNTIAAMVPTRRRPSPASSQLANSPVVSNSTPSTTNPTIAYVSSTMQTPVATKRVPPVYHSVVPTTSVVIESEIADVEEPDDVTTENISTTKRTRRPGNKKKKKPSNSTVTGNKNRRRRPTDKDPEDLSVLESKITQELANATKNVPSTAVASANPPPPGSRPLSTRIYNYLAREVMPSVGVGVVGLLLTAGLAGLFLYPFGGGVAARRTSYETTKNAIPSPDGHMYYYNEYASKSDVDNAQNEEAVFGQVLSGMTQTESQYESRPGSNNNNNHKGSNNSNNNSNDNSNKNNNNNNSNNNKYNRYESTLPHSAANAASVVYPSTKDAQKYTQTGTSSSEQSSTHLGGSRIQDSATGYSTLTDISAEGSHNDRNYPSLTTDTITDNQYDSSQFSSSISGSSGSTYTSAASKTGNSGVYNNAAQTNANPQYSSLIGSPITSQNSNNGPSYTNMQNPSSNSQYSSLIGSTPNGNSNNGNSNPSYSSLISSPSVSLTGTNTGPHYQSLVGTNPSTNVQSSSSINSPQYSPMISSSSTNSQYPSLIDNSGSNHYSKSSITASGGGIHQYSQMSSDHNTGSQYSTLTGITVDNADNSKYPSLTTQSHQSHHQSKYQTSGEYAAYNNPSDVGTQSIMSYGASGSSSMENHRTSDQDSQPSAASLTSVGSSPSAVSASNTWKEMDYGVGVSVVEKDTIKEEDKSDKSQPQFAALHSPQYMSSLTDQSSFPSNVDMISITGGSSYNPTSSGTSSGSSTADRHRQSPITSIEHGPRYFHLTHKRRRRQVETVPSTSSSSASFNEIDGQLPNEDPSDTSYKYVQGLTIENLVKSSTDSTTQPNNDETTTEIVMTTVIDSTTIQYDDNSTSINNTNSDNSTTHDNIEESLKDTEPTTQRPPNDDFTFLGFVRRLAHLKLKLGLSFLRSTSQAVSKYLQSVQQRMEKVVRRLEKRARSNDRERNSRTNRIRSRRDTKQNERKQKHKKSSYHNKKQK